MESKRKSVTGLLKDFFTYGFGNVIIGTMSIIMTPILTRIFTPHQYGAIDVVQTSMGILATIGTLQMDSAILRYYNDDNCDKKELRSTYLVSLAAISFLIAGLGILLRNHINTLIFEGDRQVGDVLAYSFLTIPSTLLMQHVLIIFRTLRKARHVITTSVSVSLVYFLLAIVFVVPFKSGIKGIFLARFITEIAIALYIIYREREHYSSSFSLDALKRMLKFGLPLMPERFANLCLTKANRFFLITYASISDIANLNIAQKIPALMMLAISGFKQAWFPYAMSIMHEKYAKEVYSQIFGTYMKSMFLLTIMIILFSKEIIILLATKEYLGAQALVGLVGGDIVMFGAAQIFYVGLFIKERVQWYSLATFLSAGGNVILNYLFIPLFGVMGAALSLYAANFIISILTYYYAQKIYHVAYNVKLFIIYFISIPVISYTVNNFIDGLGFLYKIIICVIISLCSIRFLNKEFYFVKGLLERKFFYQST